MRFRALREFLEYLERNGELHRVRTEVDPDLEISEIAVRALRMGKPALLFERVKGARYPLAINVMASEKRILMALGRDPDAIGRELVTFAEQALPPSPGLLLRNPRMVYRLLASRPRHITIAQSQEVVEKPNLHHLPVIKCWPGDGGRFITLPQVITYHPFDGKRNIGMYRMHVFDRETTGMHWQIQKGGGFHFFHAEQMKRPFELAVALGMDPASILATVAPLPEGIDEALFAGFLRGKGLDFVGGRSISVEVPANAEFILEGVVMPAERKREGPFGDHFGHYSAASDFPVFHLKAVTHRKDPIYPATVVGVPPMEDKFLGDATQEMLGPLARLLHSEVRNLWAYYEAGFHNLLVVSIEERYQKEAMKTALGLMGSGQLSLTKCLIAVSPEVDVRNFREVMKEVRDHFDPHFDFIMIPKVPLDTLDFTSYRMNLGSKMILDATRKPGRRARTRGGKRLESIVHRLPEHDRRILEAEVVEESLVIVRVSRDGTSVIRKLIRMPELGSARIVAAVSADVDIHRPESYIWGVFTRFDCERDVDFTEAKLMGISPVYRGVMGIDATWKPGYPEPLVMDPRVVKRVDERWDHYWKK